MSDHEYPTGIGTSDPDHISLLGRDLATEVLGQVGFVELAYWLATKRRPTPGQRRAFDAVLVALADHGLTPTAIAARMTYYSAPESVQGAIAAGLLGGGSRFLGVTEDTGMYLSELLADVDDHAGPDDAAWDEIAREAVAKASAKAQRIPGLGHPIHKHGDPRTPVLLRIAREAGVYGPHLSLLEAIGRVHSPIIGRRLPLNGAGIGGAMLVDAGLPVELLRGFALLARTAGLIGHLAEERIAPIAPSIYAEVDGHAVYRPADVSHDPR